MAASVSGPILFRWHQTANSSSGSLCTLRYGRVHLFQVYLRSRKQASFCRISFRFRRISFHLSQKGQRQEMGKVRERWSKTKKKRYVSECASFLCSSMEMHEKIYGSGGKSYSTINTNRQVVYVPEKVLLSTSILVIWSRVCSPDYIFRQGPGHCSRSYLYWRS